MKSQPRNSTVTKALLFCALVWFGACAWAGPVAGSVRQLSGPLLAKKADGRIKVLAMRSEVEEGDTLVSEKNTYALIRFIDNSEITLKPNSAFKVERFSYDAAKPGGDSASFSLVKGGLRSVTGLLGKRNKEKYLMKTPVATIGIRGTTYTAHWVAPDEQLGSGAPALPPGLHLSVTDGAIVVTSNGGSLGFQAGQFGYVPSAAQPPVLVPPNPDIPAVTPPGFEAGAVGGDDEPGAPPAECIVR